MPHTILITGGAGFIGRHVASELLHRGYRLKVLDSFIPQVHGKHPADLGALGPDVALIHGDIRDPDAVRLALAGVEGVIHLAAEVGVGQSMYEVERYVSTNDVGTAVLLEELARNPVRRIVTASSMSIYGEGLYRTVNGDLIEKAERAALQDGQRCWELMDADGRPLAPLPTPETKPPNLSSIYALNKFVQERATQIMAAAYGMESVCLRLFNVYGPGQALSNPYTGVLAIFASRLLNGEPPMIFEDGKQRRDFVHVRDVARAFADALEKPQAAGSVLNIGSGQDRTVEAVAVELARAMGREDIFPRILGKARKGDIRHCFCDTQKAQEVLSFAAREQFSEGLAELAEWVNSRIAEDRVDQARSELELRGLVA